MSKLDGTTLRIVLYEGPGSDSLDDEKRLAMLSGLLEAGYSVTRCATGDAELSDDSSPAVVLGCFDESAPPRVEGLHCDTRLYFLDVSHLDARATVALAKRIGEQARARPPGVWKPWFPVIDYDRCTHCMQCLSFCLFSVFSEDESGGVRVRNPDRCKTDCPACSRVCPEVAILFPKYDKEPINGGAVREESLDRQAMKVDVSALLGGDNHSLLRKRSQKAKRRFSAERTAARAIEERRRCLREAQGELDMPEDALLDLSAAEEIAELAQQAGSDRLRRQVRARRAVDRNRPPSEEDWGI